jgi:hypothetical protein
MSVFAESRRPLVLGLLACALGGYVYLTTPEKPTVGAEASKKTERPALDFTPEQVTQIEVLFDARNLTCQRTAEGWKKVSTGELLRSDAVDDFLASLTKLVRLGEVETGTTSLAEYGLQPPVARILLQIEGEGSRVLSLGKHNPVQTSLYAQINESPQVVLVGAVVLWDLRKLTMAANSAG